MLFKRISSSAAVFGELSTTLRTAMLNAKDVDLREDIAAASPTSTVGVKRKTY